MSRVRRAVTILLVLSLTGCVGARVRGIGQPLASGGYGVTMDLVNFAFRPNMVTVQAGRPITVTAVSTSIAKHNVTIVSSDGEVLANVDVPARQTRSFEVTLREPGSYRLYCDVWLHSPLGMRGTFFAW